MPKRAIDFGSPTSIVPESVPEDSMYRSKARKRLRFDDVASRISLHGQRSRPSASTRELGERVGSSDCRKCFMHDTASNISPVTADINNPSNGGNACYDNTFYSSPNLLNEIVKGTGLDQRDRNIANLRGLHIKFFAQNLDNIRAKTLHYALIAPQGNLTPVECTTDFFRHYRSTRARDFSLPSAVTTTRPSTLELNTNPINTDRFKVLMHKSLNLGRGNLFANTPAMNSAGTENSYRLVEYYVPVERQIRYKDSTAVESDQLYFVWWFVQMDSYRYTDPAGASPVYSGLTNLDQWRGTTPTANEPKNRLGSIIVGYFRDSSDK